MDAVLFAIDKVIKVFEFALIARVLISWLPVSRYNKAVDLLYTITEPVLAPIRKMLSQSRLMNNSMFSMIDFSPLVAFILIGVLRRVIYMLFAMIYY